MSAPDLGDALLATARAALDRALGAMSVADVAHPALDRPGATFVTLMQAQELRGCVGTLEAHRALRTDVEENTRRAAFRDPRFAPLTVAERAITRIEVSLLTPPEPMAVAGEADLLRRLRPGADGVVLAYRERRATFLPQVWEALPEPHAFVAALKQKAGLPVRFWHDDIRIARYTVAKYREIAAPGETLAA
jgi:AmmeMemoRadiSam system protein A